MITREDFRRLALSMPGAVESAHMGHPDFRVGKLMFASMDYPKPGQAVLKLTLDQRATLIATEPAVFAPVLGGWGKHGATIMHLDHADESSARNAIRLAYGNLVG